jgi:hypothetical protein
MRATMEINVRESEWQNAAVCASNLSELELAHGEVATAVKDAEQSVIYADSSGNAFWKMATRTTHADALHQAGCRAEAEARFREAEQMQAERQLQYPLLYSVQGFQYCDLLLAAAECEAAEGQGYAKQKALLAECHAVSKRAEHTLKWVTDGKTSLLDVALDHLTLGRAALYAAILEIRPRRKESAPPIPRSQPGLASAATEIDHAVSGLRRAGQQDELPRGLLTRAWLRRLTGRATGPDSAQSDLDEAWEIAERGPMPLFQADILLYRARLFFREREYPWNRNSDGSPRGPQDDLAAAEKLINKCGYHRRDEELADAKDALKHLQNGHTP